MSDTEDTTCPLCMEEMDIIDKNFVPCPCGYRVCMWCWHHIKENMNGLCPACRLPYKEDPHAFAAVDSTEVVKKNKERKQKEKQDKKTVEIKPVGGKSTGIDRKHLHNYRVVQRNLVYIIGIPGAAATEEILRKPEYFGQYGKISKIVVHRNHTSTHATASAYVTFTYKEDAKAAIQALEGYWLEGHQIRASFGTTKYCNNFIRSFPCNNPECVYLHELGEDEDRFTKEEIQAGYSKLNQTPGRDQIVVTGGGGPSGTGKRPTTEPILPPPVFVQDISVAERLKKNNLTSLASPKLNPSSSFENMTSLPTQDELSIDSSSIEGIQSPNVISNLDVNDKSTEKLNSTTTGQETNQIVKNNNTNNNNTNSKEISNSNNQNNSNETITSSPSTTSTKDSKDTKEGKEVKETKEIKEVKDNIKETKEVKENHSADAKVIPNNNNSNNNNNNNQEKIIEDKIRSQNTVTIEKADEKQINNVDNNQSKTIKKENSTTTTTTTNPNNNNNNTSNNTSNNSQTSSTTTQQITPQNNPQTNPQVNNNNNNNNNSSTNNSNNNNNNNNSLVSPTSFNGLGNCAVFPVPISSLTVSIWSNLLKSTTDDLKINPYALITLPVTELFELTIPPVDAACMTVWPKPMSYYFQGVSMNGITHAPAGQHIYYRSTGFQENSNNNNNNSNPNNNNTNNINNINNNNINININEQTQMQSLSQLSQLQQPQPQYPQPQVTTQRPPSGSSPARFFQQVPNNIPLNHMMYPIVPNNNMNNSNMIQLQQQQQQQLPPQPPQPQPNITALQQIFPTVNLAYGSNKPPQQPQQQQQLQQQHHII